MNNSKKNSGTPSEMYFKDKHADNNVGIANLFADYFKSVYNDNVDKNYSFEYDNKVNLDFSPISKQEV